jgi:predicted RNA polymerase sigma factor
MPRPVTGPVKVLRRELAPQVLGVLVRRHGAFDECEDAVQEALLVLCCHPALTAPSQVALTLRAVGGLSTAEIARALLIPETTVAQRISRAKARIKATGAQFQEPTPTERAARMPSVLHVLYLIFNEGYTASSGSQLYRVELTAEAIRLTRTLQAHLPSDSEVAGLLALMLLTDARRPARTGHWSRSPIRIAASGTPLPSPRIWT